MDLAWILCALAFGIPVAPAIFASQILKANAFAILLTSPNPALLVARVHQRLAEVGVAASIGTAVASPGSRQVDLTDLLARADAAMYAVKAARKNGSAS